jgi:uncharacterized membrane protein YbhN (UPF0104 family)
VTVEAEASASHSPVGRLDPRLWRRPGLGIFSSAADAPRARRPSDVVLAGLMALVTLVLAIDSRHPQAINGLLTSLIKLMPGLFGWFWEVTYDFLPVWALVLLVLALFARSRKALFRDQVCALVLAFAAALGAGLLGGTSLADLWSSLLNSNPSGVFPDTRIALSVAVITTTSPHLGRPARRIGRYSIALGAVAAAALEIAQPVGAIAALALGAGSAALIHLVFGSAGGRLPLHQVAAELADLGLEVSNMEHAAFEPRGVAVATATIARGAEGFESVGGADLLLIKMYGRDAWEGSFIASLWTSLWYRSATPTTRVGRLQQVEHEAFITLLAERAGVPVQPVVKAGLAWGRDALLVRRNDGRDLLSLSPAEVTAELLAGWWKALAQLHAADLAMIELNRRSLFVGLDGKPGLTDLDAGTTAPDEVQRLRDQTQLLVSTALTVGREPAIAAALAALGSDGAAALLPYLQVPVLEPENRRAVKAADWDLSDLRDGVSEATGVTQPKLQQLHRVTWTSVVMLVVLVFVAYAVISAVQGVGLDTLVSEFQSAQWSWVIAALLLSPVIQVGLAFATMGASVRDVRFGPVLALQYAIQFLGFAVPSTAAKVALEIRFFQLIGTNAAGAVAVGVIDSLAGFVVQIFIILITMVSGLVTLDLNVNPTGALHSINWATVGIVVGLLLLAGVIVVLRLPRLRGYLVARAADSRAALGVLRSPRHLAMLFLGAAEAQIVAAVVLGFSVRAFGHSATFAELILINTLVSLFAGLVPIPGNIGVAEAALTAGLVAVGIPDPAALSAALVYRMVTYYLPPIWGGLCMRGLRKRGFI